MEPLFIQPEVELEKTAGEVDLPEDPNQWPQEILQELYKQVPYIADFQPHVTMEKVDSERGYGMGQVEISSKSEAQMGTSPDMMEAAGIRAVRIPVIIRERKLAPFDLLVNDAGKVLPLTESRLRQALFRPQAFDVTSQTPGDQSMISQLYPPYRQNYGFGGGGVAMSAGMGKQSSVLEDYLVEELEAADDGFRRPDPGDKEARVLSARGRKQVKEKNFALPGNRYPIHDASHAKNALTRVRSHGTPEEKSQVYSAVAKKYPGLAGRSSVEGVREAKAQQKKACVGFRKTSSITAALITTFNGSDVDAFFEKLGADDHLQAAYQRNNGATVGPLGILAKYEPVSQEKRAAALASIVKPTVVQLVKMPDGYLMKTASVHYWRPNTVNISRRDVVQHFGEKVALAADEAGQVTMAEGATAQPDEGALDQERPEVINEPGLYKVLDEEGGKELVGFVVPNLLDVDGSPLPLALFTNGSHSAMQPDIMGVPAGDGSNLPTGEPGGAGAFFSYTDEGELQATIPLELQGGSYASPGEPSTLMGNTFDGRPVEVSIQPNIQTVLQSPEGKMLVPQHWQWTPLGAADAVSLVSSEEPQDEAPEDWHESAPEGKPEEMESNEPEEGESEEQKESHVWVRGDEDCFSFAGPGVEKLGSAETQMVSLDDAMFLLAALGVDQAYGVTKLAHSMNEAVKIQTGRGIILAEEKEKLAKVRALELVGVAGQLRRDLTKEAAVIPDPVAVDTVLSLGFINPENIMSFVSYMPSIEESQQKLCDLLLAARVGMDLPTTALERAVRTVEEVLEGLKILAFQGQ
jgi:hypothetical protein